MNTHADKTQENKSQTVAAETSQMQSGGESTFQFVDNRPEAVAQRRLQEMANNSQQVSQLRAVQEMAYNSPQANQAAQLQSMADNSSSQQQPIQKKENNTGLPDNLKAGIENISGYSMDDVKVHYNSNKPAQLQAHAYAQGTDIHLASGQEKHLPHEAWHVAQQKQGRVKPTMQMKDGVNVNDDAGLEKEADLMGNKAIQKTSLNNSIATMNKSIHSPSIQRKEIDELVSAIGAVMDEGKLSKKQITTGLERIDQEDINDTNFPRSLVEFVKQRNGVNDFSITDLEEAPDPKFGRKHLSKNWTFRHYTNEKFTSLRSLADLEASGIDASANTNDKDWEELGNQGYVFGLIAVEGKVPQRSWLSKMKYYAEYNLRDLPSVWVSADMLDDDGRAMASYQGTGEVIISQLSKMLSFIDQDVATAIDGKFLGKLEAKVPPANLGTPTWNDV
jgi:hypothetical protein